MDMTAKSKSKQEEALQFLDDLDSLSTGPTASGPSESVPSQPANEGEAADVLKFLDEITQKSAEPTRTATSHLDRPASRSGTPTLRKSTERIRVGATTPLSIAAKTEGSSSVPLKPESAQTRDEAASGSKGWGWNNVWSSASAALQQAKTVVDEQVKNLPNNEQAKKWSEGVMGYVKAEQLEKLGKDFKNVGLSALTDIINAVAPPISEHEVIQVWLSHDMEGYDGVESLVYRGLARIMEQVEGGDLVVNKGNESRPKEKATSGQSDRKLNAVDGLEAALKLAEANVQELIRSNAKTSTTQPPSTQNPTTYSFVYIRIQPFFSAMRSASASEEESTALGKSATEMQLQFIVHLSDPDHNLSHTTTTQAVPEKWLELWESHDWVEDLVVEVLRVGIEVIGQAYVADRMGWVQDNSRSQVANSTSTE